MKLRGKLLLVSLSLLVLPWAGWQFLRLMADVLREGQEQAALASAEAIARGLAQRPNSLPPAGPALFAQALSRRPALDGLATDWGEARAAIRYFGSNGAVADAADNARADLASVTAASADDVVYLFIEVPDGTRQRGDAHWPVAARRDHVGLSLRGRQGIVRVRLANAGEGPLRVAGEDGGPAPMGITGAWRETTTGYAIELALPQGYALSALALRVLDVDESDAVRVLSTSDNGTSQRPWALLMNSPALAGSLEQLLPSGQRARLYAPDGWLLAQAGTLTGLSRYGAVPIWRRWLYQRLLFAHDSEQHSDREAALRSQSTEVAAALAGRPTTLWQRDADSQRLVLTAAVPLSVAGTARAALLLEGESDAVLRLTDRAFSGLFASTLLALLAAVAALFLFAGRLSARIRRLRDAAERALDRDGRVHAFPVVRARDEIGDLSRSFAKLLAEVDVYTGYLRGLAGKLSHEITTPIAIVRTSLENLEADPQAPAARTYIERARGGIDRLGALVRAMSEATRIEQAIAAADSEDLDLRKLVADCAEGYRPLLAPRALRVELPAAPVFLHGAPELIAQALDKLIDNARGFTPEDGWVAIGLSASGDTARLRVANSGPALPAAMREQLFDSLVSVRERGRDSAVHLGFGLYVVKLIAELHRGRVEAHDLPDGSGVEFVLQLRALPPR